MNNNFFVQTHLIYATISIGKAYIKFAEHLCRTSLHVAVLRGWKRHQLFLFFSPVVGTAMLFLLEKCVIQLIQIFPDFLIKRFQRKVPSFLQGIEESLFRMPTAFSTSLLYGFLTFARRITVWLCSAHFA